MHGGGQQERGAWVAGYRLIRRLGRGSHSELYLGRADDAPEGAEGIGAVVVKVFDAATDHDLVSDQVSVLTIGAATGLPRLVDLATLADGRVVLVLERLAGPSLATVLGARSRIAPGEAVTILAPVVVALSSLHRRGFAHTTLSQATVRFRADGHAHLTGFGGIRRLPGFTGRHGQAPAPGDGLSRVDFLRDDYRRLALLMRSVFDRLPRADATTRRAEALLAWFEMAATAVPFQPGLDELERRLFAWSPAAAVRFAEPSPVVAVPARVDATGSDPGAPPPRSANGVTPAGPGRHGALRALLAGAARGLEGDPLRLVRRRLRVLAAARRGPLIVSACVVVAVTVLALTLLPPATPPASPEQPAAAGTPERGAAVPPRHIPDQASPSAGAHPMTGAIMGDAPVRAANALLAGRAGCLAAASVACLAAFDQAGSALMESDGYAIDHGIASEERRAAGGLSAVDLAERTGDLALVTLRSAATPGGDSEPASLLLVRGEAGWRLRQIVD